VFGERWLPAAPFVAVTAACVPLQAIRLLLQSLITATGRPGLNLQAGAAELITLAVSIPLLQSSGLMGAACAWLLREVVVCMWLSLQVSKLGTLAPSAPWKAAAPGLVAMLVMLAACELFRRLVVNPQWPAAATLLAVMLVGTVAFSAAALLLDRQLIARFRRVLLGRGASASPPTPAAEPGE
jgi:O-antigen/teichoic acid export membrane protein